MQEQGIGDTIMFANVISDICNRYPGAEIHLAVENRMIKIFGNSYPRITVFDIHDTSIYDKGETEYNFIVPIGNILSFFRKKKSDFPLKPYIYHNGKVSSKRTTRIGISWHSQKSSRRSIKLDQLLPILSIPGIEWVDCQYGDHIAEIEDFQQKYNIKIIHDELIQPMQDLQEFANQLGALDGIITIDNTTVHLAGACGIKCYLMLPTPCSWRWQIYTKQSIWYPSIELFRQKETDNWQDPIHKVRDKILADFKC